MINSGPLIAFSRHKADEDYPINKSGRLTHNTLMTNSGKSQRDTLSSNLTSSQIIPRTNSIIEV
jgi:hypothetical protein